MDWRCLLNKDELFKRYESRSSEMCPSKLIIMLQFKTISCLLTLTPSAMSLLRKGPELTETHRKSVSFLKWAAYELALCEYNYNKSDLTGI